VIKDFIGIWDNVLSKEECDNIIEVFKDKKEKGLTQNRYEFEGASAIKKKDNALFDDQIDFSHYGGTHSILYNKFIKSFWDTYYKEYALEYGVLDEMASHSVYELKIQETESSCGYHIWHCEHSSRTQSNRIASFILYLNDDFENGETEFLYQKTRVKPKTGRLVLFPASFTHTHRGNPPYNGTKYILTSWVEF